ncbi:MAG: M3 family metallopeptidase [Alloprevotella sp.]|nr:M3 family metallopeptidase [Alloprevotella sp.]
MTDTIAPAANPLFAPFREADAIPFSLINESHFIPAIERGIEIARQEIKAIAENPDEPTVENTLIPLASAGDDLDRALNIFGVLNGSMMTDSMMEIDAKVQPMYVDYSLSILHNPLLRDRIQSLYNRRDSLGLDTETARLLDRYHDTFLNAGAFLSDHDKEKYAGYKKRLADLHRLFSENIVKEMREMTLSGSDLSELDGVTEEVFSHVKAGPDGKGWILPISQPIYIQVMQTAQNRDLRHRLYLLWTSRCNDGQYDNRPILSEIVSLSYKTSRLLGFPSAAHQRLQRRMAATPDKVMELLYGLRDAYLPALPAEIKEIEAIAGHSLEPWDYSYEANRLKKEAYDYDPLAMRPYLELGNVMKGIFSLAKTLFDVDFEEITGSIDTYHPDVRVYRVTHPSRGFLGLVYYDFYARTTKRPGAWMTEFRAQCLMPDGSDRRPYINVVANIAKPTNNDTPTLLFASEAETLLHETGHALHGLLSACRYEALSGTSVERDFVELPSQFFEAFLTRPEFLDIAGRHYETGESIPSELLAALKRVSSFGAAYQCLRQLAFGLIDMAWYTLASADEIAQASADVTAFERSAMASVKVFDEPVTAAISPSFSHIFAGGYSAGYYSYKWAEVLAADAFEAVAGAPDKDEPLNIGAARAFADKILSRGNSDDPDHLYRAFRGAQADPKALLRRDFPAHSTNPDRTTQKR